MTAIIAEYLEESINFGSLFIYYLIRLLEASVAIRLRNLSLGMDLISASSHLQFTHFWSQATYARNLVLHLLRLMNFFKLRTCGSVILLF